MKKAIFIVDDEINYLEGLLKTIEYTINNEKNEGNLIGTVDEYQIFFLNIMLTDDVRKQEESCKKIIKKVENRVTSKCDFQFVPVEVCCIVLDNNEYKKNPSNISNLIIDKQKELLERFANLEDHSYVMLIDVILNLSIDQDWLESKAKNKKKPLSYLLAKNFTYDKCIVYTKYNEYNHGQQWKNLINWPTLPFPRFKIAEGNVFYPFKERFFEILSSNVQNK